MTNWSFDPASNSGTLSIAGDMTINHVSVLKESLVKAFADAAQVTVDVSAATAIDVAGVQLLCACHRFSAGRGRQMCIRLGENQQFMQFLDAVGFARDFICSHSNGNQCLWTSLN